MVEVSDELVAFRAEVRSWLEENFPQSLSGKGNVIIGGTMSSIILTAMH